MDTRLIIVDGPSSVGKSSLSKSLYRQLSLQQQVYWLHEECLEHPIRHQEFSFGALDTAAGMEANRVGMLHKWGQFRESIQDSGQVCITEGCLLHAYDRYFIHSCWGDAQISAYFSQVMEVLQALDPVVVFLYRPDLRKSLEQAFTARGQWWRELILRRDDRHVYFKDHAYVNENSMFAAVEFEQARMLAFFDGLTCRKLKIDTSQEQWDAYVREMLAILGASYQEEQPHPCDLERYAGTYRWQAGTPADEWIIRYDDARKCLYTSLFWPYMPMQATAEQVFELISFPVALHFQEQLGRLQFVVRGNYDWEYNDQVFIRV